MARKAEKEAQAARRRVESWRSYFSGNIKNYHFMMNFVLGKQWDDEESRLLRSYKKIPLSFNKLSPLLNSLLGEQQQNTPQLDVVPLSDADEETASIRESVVKDNMLSSDAKSVYQNAAKQSFGGGYGAFYLDTEYEHDDSFNQKITYNSLKDPTRAYWDPSAKKDSKIDGMYGGFTDRISRKRFRALYGKKIENEIKVVNSDEEVDSEGSGSTFNWADDDSISLIYDFERKFKSKTIYKLSNGRVVNQDELDSMIVESKDIIIADRVSVAEEELSDEQLQEIMDEVEATEVEILTLYDDGEPVRIEDKRKVEESSIKHRVFAGDYLLEETDFPSNDIPVIFVDQNSYYDKNGAQVTRAFMQDAIDTQKFLNYLGTQTNYLLKISRYDQFIGSAENIRTQDSADIWRDPLSIQGMLTYDKASDGSRPEQLRPPELPQSLIQQYQRAIEDIHTCTGLYPSRMGEQGNEISGKAIDARTRQGSYATYVAFNSLNKAITAGGKVLNQMIPNVYDSERVITMMTADSGRKSVPINVGMDVYGAQIQNDLTRGTYEVELVAGPSYEGQKQEALNSLNMVIQSNPSLFNMFADLYAENLPLANSLEIKNRLKTIVPPEVVEAGKTGQMPQQKQNPNPQDLAAMEAIQIKKEELELKKQKLLLDKQEAESRNQIAMIDLEIQKIESMAKLEGERLRYLSETDRTASDNAIAHADNITKIITSKA